MGGETGDVVNHSEREMGTCQNDPSKQEGHLLQAAPVQLTWAIF